MYLLNLYKQFNEAFGINPIDFTDDYYMEAFNYWLRELRISSRKYQQFILELGVDIDNEKTIELRKGKYDSISLPNTRIISPYGDTLGRENSDIIMFQGEPLIVGSKKIKREQVAETYITQNPYCLCQLDDIDYFYEIGANICIGVYGNNRDIDKNKKIRQLEEYKKIFLPNASEEYETFDDTYFYILRNKGKVLERKKNR